MSLGFGFTTISLLLRPFGRVFGLGFPGCRLLAFVLAILVGFLPSLFGFDDITAYQRVDLFGFLQGLQDLRNTTKNNLGGICCCLVYDSPNRWSEDGTYLGSNQSMLIGSRHSKQLQIDSNTVT